jgi:hypothetical protein
MCFRDRSHHFEDSPNRLFVHDGNVVVNAARESAGFWFVRLYLRERKAPGQRVPVTVSSLLPAPPCLSNSQLSGYWI